MPHKHTRRQKDASTFELPPTEVARPLPVVLPPKTQAKRGTKPSTPKAPDESKRSKRKRGGDKDDAPRAFKRLMAFASGNKPRSGLDDGAEPSSKKKKKKAKATDDAAPPAADAAPEMPTIKPGEKLSDFAARVDQALPLAGLVRKGVKNGKDPVGLKVWKTHKERQMHKLYDQWRDEERKIQEKREEAEEGAEEKAMEEEEAGITWRDGAGAGGVKKKKGKRARLVGEAADKEDDPWEELRKKRGEAKVGLHDVAQAPPELKKLTGKKLTVRGAAVEVDGIPKAAGSLRRREELQEVRNELVSSYRQMMEKKRALAAASTGQ